ncbi:MAG TPA: hypothetical protein VGK53_02200 [Propionicimonas sp.]
MTDPYARPADDGGDATIPIVPEAGYAPTEQLPFAEETLVDPAGPGSLWSANSGLDLSAPGYGGSSGTQPPTPPAAYPPPSGYPTPAAYTPTNYTQPTASYTQPTAAYSQSGYGQPAPQTNYVQPQVTPSPPAPYRPAPVQGFAEPSGPADTIGAQSIYQGYPTAPGAPAPQQPAWPAVIQDPVGYDYGYSNPANLSEHPNATLSMVLGIIGLVFFQLLSPVAWYLAAKGRREMAMSPGRWRPSGSLTAGFVLGIIGTVFLALGAVFILVLIGIIASTGGG